MKKKKHQILNCDVYIHNSHRSFKEFVNAKTNFLTLLRAKTAIFVIF